MPRHLRHQGLRHRRRFLVSQVKTRIFFEKTEFPCSSTSILIWWLSSKPGHTSTTAAKPRRLPKTESTCGFKSALIFALSDVSRRLYCSSTATAAYQKFPTAPCSPTRGLLRPPAWLCASEYREAPGPPGGCVGFTGLAIAFPPSTTMMLAEESAVSRSCFLIPLCLPVYPCACHKGAVSSSTLVKSAPLLQFGQ